MKLEFSLKIFKKYPNINFHECLSGGSRVDPYRQMGEQIEKDMKKLVAPFHNFANMPKNVKTS